MSDDLTIQIFFFTSAFLALVEALKAVGWRAYAFWGLCGVLALLGALWRALKGVSPTATSAITDVATSAQSWFVLGVLGLVLIAVTGRKVSPLGGRVTAGPPTQTEEQEVATTVPAEWLPEMPGSIEALSTKLDSFARSVAIGAEKHDGNLESLRNGLNGLYERVEGLERTLAPKQMGLLGSSLNTVPSHSRLDDVENKADGARDYAKGILDALSDRINSLQGQIQTNYTILATSLRARDALEMLKEHDSIVSELGPKLIAASPEVYPNGRAWAADHNSWGSSIENIDRLLSSWLEHHDRFLKIERMDYEREKREPPPQIRDEHNNTVRYKDVCIAQERYARQRDGIVNFFATKVSEIPG